MNYIAHIRGSDGKIQSVEAHLLEVKVLAESFGAKVGIKHIAGLAGLLHDMGKYTHAFREYIQQAVQNPDSPPKRGSVDHSTAGGKLLFEMFHTGAPSRYDWILAEIVGNAILSHHGYLLDFLSPDLESPYLQRVEKKELDEFDRAKRHFLANVMNETEFRSYVARASDELQGFMTKPSPISDESKVMFLTKFVFSALIDADRTNTRIFEEGEKEESKPARTTLFTVYYDKLMAKLDSFRARDDAQHPIAQLRRDMSEQCERFAAKPSGIYTLSIPTGGGKTLASLRYALKHAQEYGKKRIIYVVPYTTIIEQNAEEVRRILQDDAHVLEHHSNVVDDLHDEDEHEDGIVNERQKLKLAKDNWDSPIVFTTMVQFLDVFFAAGSRNVRRLHNLSESVIIFDEVQKVPVRCVSLFNQALNFLKTYCNTSLILCTATQPALDFVEHKLAVNPDAEIIDDLNRVIDAFKRVEIVDRAMEALDTERLAEFVLDQLQEVRSALVILNTKGVVKKLYERLEKEEIPLYHLSTSMCAAHRHRILENVRKHLRNEEKVVCVSTQLIEAGVDISFDCVIRSLAGLDSIAQAAGRCNRHGKNGIRKVYVIDHAEENLKHLPEIKVGKKETQKILADLRKDPSLHGGSPLSQQAMRKYFQEFFKEFETSLDYPIPALSKSAIELLTVPRQDNSYYQAYKSNAGDDLRLFIVNSYRTAAERFQVIDSPTVSVLVPYGDEGKEVIAELSGGTSIAELSKLLRRAQPYTVNLFRHEQERLAQNDGLVGLLDGKVLALKEGAYNRDFGVDSDNESGFDAGIF